jgi:hypothetical protein
VQNFYEGQAVSYCNNAYRIMGFDTIQKVIDGLVRRVIHADLYSEETAESNGPFYIPLAELTILEPALA